VKCQEAGVIETELSGDEQMLRDTAAKFVQAACPLTTVRQLIESETGLPGGYLRQIGDLGWLGLSTPDPPNGQVAGDSVTFLAAVAEERGRGLQPGAFIPMSAVIAGLGRSGSGAQRDEVLASLVAGDVLATWVVGSIDGGWAPGRAWSSVRDGDNYILSGTGLAQDGAIAGWLLITTADRRGLSQFLIRAGTPGLSVESCGAHDVTQRFATVTLDGVMVPSSARVGDDGGAAADVELQMRVAALLIVAETVGAMDALFEMTRLYALERFAFGRPIGSFQAVKHQLADLSLSLEATRALSASATAAVSSGRDDAGEIVSMAKAWAGDAGIEIAQGCFQVFGGIGYTWEHDSHLFLRRITMNGLLFGGSTWHRERICTLHGI
jgi:alkylation response protein AidB-like acyl-CoA dehydrogenase